MIECTISIKMDNDAFCDDPLFELGDCLSKAHTEMLHLSDKQGGEICGSGIIRDRNGNKVGEWEIG